MDKVKINVVIPRDLLVRLDQAAIATYTSRSEFIRRAIIKELPLQVIQAQKTVKSEKAGQKSTLETIVSQLSYDVFTSPIPKAELLGILETYKVNNAEFISNNLFITTEHPLSNVQVNELQRELTDRFKQLVHVTHGFVPGTKL